MCLRPGQPLFEVSLFSIGVFFLTCIHDLHIIIIIRILISTLLLVLVGVFIVHLSICLVLFGFGRCLLLYFILSLLIDSLILGE